jgi:hypothetical protein
MIEFRHIVHLKEAEGRLALMYMPLVIVILTLPGFGRMLRLAERWFLYFFTLMMNFGL